MTDTAQRARSAGPSSTWPVAAIVWSAVFGLVHLYWAGGGRRGLGGSADDADAALAAGWFQLYNLSTAALAVCGAGLAATLLRPGIARVTSRWVGRLAVAAAVVLLARGTLGTVLLIAEAVGDDPAEHRPVLLVLVEPWFVLGGIVFTGVWRVARR